MLLTSGTSSCQLKDHDVQYCAKILSHPSFLKSLLPKSHIFVYFAKFILKMLLIIVKYIINWKAGGQKKKCQS